MHDFWQSSGIHLLDISDDNQLLVTDDFLRAYFYRPEIRPADSACQAEQQLHQTLLDDPRHTVTDTELATLADADSQDNYRVLLRYRDYLCQTRTLEHCYMALFRESVRGIPSLFTDQLAHVILRHALTDVRDPLLLRAGELLFRTQQVKIDEETGIMLADSETVEMHATPGGYGDIGSLVVGANTSERLIELDVLGDSNAERYWSHHEHYDTVLNIAHGSSGLAALCRVLERWTAHFLGVATSITPLQRIQDDRWAWHIGLDADSMAILNDLYQQKPVSDARLQQILALFKLSFADLSTVSSKMAERPVYLGLAMNKQQRLILKPQNLLMNLPMATTN